ncbi:MAG: amidohydrolase family protein [Phycisphaeraceae bacterium]|nr:amidohydrolase family protein [Phycisphaeraceae bacterium]
MTAKPMNPKELRDAAQYSPIRLDASGAADGAGFARGAVSFLVDARGGCSHLRLLAAGSAPEVDGHPAARGARVFDLRGYVLLPAMVNAHTHLDLTHIGPRAHAPGLGFVPWVEMIRAARAADDDEARRSVLRGIELSRSAGVVAAGDIAGAPRDTPGRASLAPWRAMREAGFGGVSFLEFFAIGSGRERFMRWLPALLDEAARAAREEGAPRIGLQPHAPNTVELAAYEWAARVAAAHGLPLSTHLAETSEEREFIGAARGPMRDMLERFGLWDERAAAEIGHGRSPAAHVAGVLRRARPLAAHVNDASDADLGHLSEMGATVAYCPRASAYFGAPAKFGPHRYRDMLRAGVPVALGTDSLVNLPADAARTPAEGGRGMSILDEMRFLWHRDGTDASALLAMGTVHGAGVLGLDTTRYMFSCESPGAGPAGGREIAGIVGVCVGQTRGDAAPLLWVMESDRPAELLLD